MTRNGTSNWHRLAVALGWFSIGLGVAELLAPRRVAKTAGVKSQDTLMRAFGLREIATGIGILAQRKRSRWLWARVAGDALDLAMLGAALSSKKSNGNRIAAAGAAVAGVAALDVLCGRKLSHTESNGSQSIHVTKSITIDRSPEELYQFWRNFENLPQFMNHLKWVKVIDENRSHWVVNAPAGTSVQWDAEVVSEVPNESIEWCSLPGADVDNFGLVRFDPAPAGRGTIVKVSIEYSPPAGRLGAKIAKILGEAPEKQIAMDLRRFKQLMETGEVARTEGQPAGRGSSTSKIYDDFVRH